MDNTNELTKETQVYINEFWDEQISSRNLIINILNRMAVIMKTTPEKAREDLQSAINSIYGFLI